MSALEEASFLKRRALDFLDNAKRNLKEKKFDLSVFNSEQSVQLFMKYLLFLKAGDYPKTHSLKQLFKELSKYFNEFESVLKNNIDIIGNLESAYIGARYLPLEYMDFEAEKIVNFSMKIKKLVDKYEK